LKYLSLLQCWFQGVWLESQTRKKYCSPWFAVVRYFACRQTWNFALIRIIVVRTNVLIKIGISSECAPRLSNFLARIDGKVDLAKKKKIKDGLAKKKGMRLHVLQDGCD